MSLCVINNQSEELCNTAVVRFVQDSLEQQGRCVVVVPRHKLARQLLRELAQHKNCSVGVQVETPLSYARSLWELWGDGRRLISADVRIVLMSRCLAASQEQGLSVATDKGTARFLARLAQHHLPWLGITDQGELDGTLMASAGLSACETEAFRVIASYKSEIKARGFIEESELMAEVAKLSSSASLVLPPRVLATGFTSLPRAQRSFFEGLAEASQLHIMTRSESGPAFERMQQDLTLLTAAVAESKIDIEELHVAADICERAPELEQLLSSIFYQGRTCESTGAVRLLIASGPLAEAELIARKIDQLPAADIKQIVLATPDPIRMWHELGPKLYQSHISVSADLSQAFFDTEAGRALYEYLTVIVQLALLDETWPSPLESTEGALIQLGDMQWWPPQQLTDFLLSPLSGVSSETAYRLDKEWRANRLLTPRAVLNTLMSSRHGSPALEQATRELLKNRPTSAGSRLLRQFLERVREQYETDSSHNADTAQSESSIYVGEMTIAQVEAVLSALMKINTKLKEPDFTYDGLTQAQKLNLSVQELTLALEQSRISMRPQLIVDDAEQELRIMSYADAAQLNPASQDCLIVSGATSGEDPIGVGDELTQSLLCRLGAEREDNRLAAAREQFLALLAVPSKLIICERTLFTADSKPAYPSVMLTELLGCYNVDAQNYDELKGFVDLQLGE
ncbi:MAG: hypothetical protein IJ125_00960 [Atopobiaceae bacterium]|nr:hypothetical protein [Atopobiaceae bacterium]